GCSWPCGQRMLTSLRWGNISAAARIGATGLSPAFASAGAKAGVQTALRETTGPAVCCNVAEACDDHAHPCSNPCAAPRNRSSEYAHANASTMRERHRFAAAGCRVQQALCKM